MDEGKAAPHGTVLVVDDDEAIVSLLKHVLTREGYATMDCRDGESALEAVRGRQPDVVLLDVAMPGINGFEVCRRLKTDAATRLLPVLLITGLPDHHHRIEGLKAGADDFLTKPIDLHELLARVASLTRIKRYTDDLESAASIICTLATMVEARDGDTPGHCNRMSNYATALGRHLGLPDVDLQALQRGGFIHDIGMLAIPETVSEKQTKLTPEEFELIKSHTIIGDSLIANLKSLAPVRPIVRHHHERYDGSGYPDGLVGDAIPLVAQIMGIVDVYDAITTRRSYQHTQSPDVAIDILRRQVAMGWRRGDLVEAFATMIASRRFPLQQ
jgi:putative two-component system response regulator